MTIRDQLLLVAAGAAGPLVIALAQIRSNRIAATEQRRHEKQLEDERRGAALADERGRHAAATIQHLQTVALSFLDSMLLLRVLSEADQEQYRHQYTVARMQVVSAQASCMLLMSRTRNDGVLMAVKRLVSRGTDLEKCDSPEDRDELQAEMVEAFHDLSRLIADALAALPPPREDVELPEHTWSIERLDLG